MRVDYFAWFESESERTEFIKLLNSSRTEMEAVSKVLSKYPEIVMTKAAGIVQNFKKEIGKDYETK